MVNRNLIGNIEIQISIIYMSKWYITERYNSKCVKNSGVGGETVKLCYYSYMAKTSL